MPVAVAQHSEHRVERQLHPGANLLQASHTLGVVIHACRVVVLARVHAGLEVYHLRQELHLFVHESIQMPQMVGVPIEGLGVSGAGGRIEELGAA